MDHGSILGSLDRIEVALERIERAARARKAAVVASADTDLAERHRMLQGAVETALARIDTLIDEQRR